MHTHTTVIYKKYVKGLFHDQQLMTEKLYWSDAYQTKFTAKVIEVNNQGIILDKSLFYPEGGNQVSDKGIIRKDNHEFKVSYVSKDNITILHHLSNNFQEIIKVGDTIEGIIDWEYRYGIMRAHSSQHLLSAIFKNLFNIDTIRANISYEDVTLHIAKSITEDQIKTVLRTFLKMCTIESLELQSKILDRENSNKLTEEIRGDLSPEEDLRIIEIQEYDVNCCGGTHVKNTVEIGPCYFYDIKKNKEFKYYVGTKAIELFTKQNFEIIQFANLLNQQTENLLSIVKDQINKLTEENVALIHNLLETIAQNPVDISKDIKIGIANLDIDYKILTKEFKEFPSNYILVMRRAPKSILILSNTEKFKANEAIDTLITKYGGKGGGSSRSAQVILESEPKDLIIELKALI